MTLAAIGTTYWPTQVYVNSSLSAFFSAITITFDSDTDRVAWVGRAQLTDSLTTIYFRTGTVTTGCTVDVRVETVSNGRPSGTLWSANTAASVTIADSDDNVWKTATLTSSASFTIGDEYAIVISVDVAGATPNLQLSMGFGGSNGYWGMYPVLLQDTGAGTWASPSSTVPFSWIQQFNTAGVVPTNGMLPTHGAGTATTYNSGSTDDEVALRFQVPFKCRVVGARVLMANIAAGADFSVTLWPASSTTDSDALAQKAEDGDAMPSATADGYVEIYFGSAVTLTVNTTYYLGVRADTANNISVVELTTATVTNAMLAYPGVNAQTYKSRRAWTGGSAGSWTDTTTSLPVIHLIIDQLDDGAGGGGGMIMTRLQLGM